MRAVQTHTHTYTHTLTHSHTRTRARARAAQTPRPRPSTTTNMHTRLSDAERMSVAHKFCTPTEFADVFRDQLDLNCQHIQQLVENYQGHIAQRTHNHKRAAGPHSGASVPKKRSRQSVGASASSGPDTTSESSSSMSAEAKAALLETPTNPNPNPTNRVTANSAAGTTTSAASASTAGALMLRTLSRLREDAVAMIAMDRRPYLSRDPPPEVVSERPSREDPNTREGWKLRATWFFERAAKNPWNEVRVIVAQFMRLVLLSE
jgi:hypothetical protein